MLSLKGRVRATVLVIKPKGFPAGWEETDIVASARRIPGTTVLLDLDGTQAARFGAKTSGQAVLYDGSGKLLFSGGITEGRGHLGDNAGLQRIKSLVLTGKADKAESLVFGCPLSAKVCPMGKVESNQQSSKGEVHVQQSKL
jgi:hypothetical protein